MIKTRLTYKLYLFFLIAIVCLCPVSIYAAPDYLDYIAEMGNVSAGADTATIDAADYISGDDVEKAEDALLTGSDSVVKYSVNVSKSGYYYISLLYKPVIDGNGLLLRTVEINDALPFVEAENISFKRFYQNLNNDYKEEKGDQMFPRQVEVAEWKEAQLFNSDSYVVDSLKFYLEKGDNTITFKAVEGEMLIKTIKLTPALQLPAYSEYASKHAGQPKLSDLSIKTQGQDADRKSSPGIYPITDRTSPLVEPYDPDRIVLNAIGGKAWDSPGQAVEWDIDVPQTGMYKIAIKAKQEEKIGDFSTRILKINGEIPFAEAADIRFDYDTTFSLKYLSDIDSDEDYYFFLEKGKNTITLEATLGVYGEIITKSLESLRALNGIYHDISLITGFVPDKYRDYNLDILIPDLKSRFIEQRDNIEDIKTQLVEVAGKARSSNQINKLITQLEIFINDANEIPRYFVDFKSSVSALGDWILTLQNQALEVDYFIIASGEQKLPAANGNFFQNIIHSVRSFFASFRSNYNAAAVKSDNANAKSIDVWVSAGRDQYNVIRRVITDSFTPEYGVNVNVNLVGADVIFPASITGNGPDVILQISAGTPLNFGYRDGAYDLTQLPGFDEVAKRFPAAAIDTFRYNGACYALPDQMSFNMMFYRKDVFDELNLSAPNTIDELLALVPTLQTNNMDVYLQTGGQQMIGSVTTTGNATFLNSVFASLLYQNGGYIYNDGGKTTAIGGDIGTNIFKQWTELYTKHNFIVETNFATRFRIGEIPIGVVDLSNYNTLSVAAPEIKGNWQMAQIPGTRQPDGSIRYDNAISVSGSMIVKSIAEQHKVVDESWEFLKWWTSDDVQYRFATEMESVLGLSARYTPANLNAFYRISWSKDNKRALENTIEWLKAVPQVPGSYITGRVMDNAFLSVITKSTNANPNDAIFNAVDLIDQELASKRKEFNLE